MTIVELKKEYRKQLSIIKDDNNGKTVRNNAFRKIVELYHDIINEEPKCPIDSPQDIKIQFIDKINMPDVVWNYDTNRGIEDAKIEQEIERLENIRMIAYFWVKMNHPKLDDQSDKFSQIVNARMQIIIASR